MSLETAWFRGGYGKGEPLHSPFCIEVEDFTVTGWWRNGKTWGNHMGGRSGDVECWRWTDDECHPDDDDADFFIDGRHEEMPVIPEGVVDRLLERWSQP